MTRNRIYREARCPACGGETLGDVELIPAYTPIAGLFDDGSAEYRGGCQVDWDWQTPMYSPPLCQCRSCGRQYVRDRLGLVPPEGVAITLNPELGYLDPVKMDRLALAWCTRRGLVAGPGRRLYLIAEVFGGSFEGYVYAGLSEQERDDELKRLLSDVMGLVSKDRTAIERLFSLPWRPFQRTKLVDPGELSDGEFWERADDYIAHTDETEYRADEIELPVGIVLHDSATVRVIREGGAIHDVEGLPPGWDYEIVELE